MARSRRRIVSRQSNSSSRFSYAVWGKGLLVALGLGGGTFGVHQVVTSIPTGAVADSSGTEVGPHLAEVASSQKPPLPDEPQSGTAGVFPPPSNRLAQANDPAADLRSVPNLAAAPPSQLPNPSLNREAAATGNAGLPASSGTSSLSSAAVTGANPGSTAAPNPRLAPAVSSTADSNGLPSPLPNPAASGLAGGNPSSGLPTTPTNPAAPIASTMPNGVDVPLRSPGGLPAALPRSLAGGSLIAAATSLIETEDNPASPTPRPADPTASPLAADAMRGNPANSPNLPPPTLSPSASGPNAGGLPSGDSLANNPNVPRLNTAPTPSPANARTAGDALADGPAGTPTPPSTPGLPGSTVLPGSTSLAGGPNPNPTSFEQPPPLGGLPSGLTAPTPSSLPPSSPMIGIPTESRAATPSPLAAAPLTSNAAPLPRSTTSAGLPQPDPLASDPRRTPAAPSSFGANPNNFSNSSSNFGPDAGRMASNAAATAPADFNQGSRLPATLVSNRPGDPQWEIQQQAALVIEKLAPPAVQVNVPAKFLMVVRNVGRVPAGQVLIRDRIPEKARLIQATPKPTRQDGDLLEWELAALPPGETYQIQLELLPTEPGEIGSVAQVISSALAATRTRSTRPQLSIEHAAPPQVMVGQTVVMNIVIRNEGDGVAENVVIREIVPPQMMHPSGNEIENPLGNLAPGQTRTLQLPLVARTPGTARNTIRVTGEGKLSAEHSIDIQIVAPQLQVLGDGPERRFLSRPATHTFQVKNLGSANATNVQMMARLPQGLRYDSSSPAGRYDPSRHAVFWAMANLPNNAEQSVTLTTMPMAPGEQPIEFQALADLNQPQVTTRTLLVEQLSELFFDIDDLQDPIEVGTNTMYVIRVENQGSQVANNVAMVVDFPAGVEPLNVESPIEYQLQRDGQASRLVFAPVANMNPRAQMVIRVEARGSRDGDHRIEVRMTSAQRPTPVAKQESTKVYADR